MQISDRLYINRTPTTLLVCGQDTYHLRSILKSLGGIWNPNIKCWVHSHESEADLLTLINNYHQQDTSRIAPSQMSSTHVSTTQPLSYIKPLSSDYKINITQQPSIPPSKVQVPSIPSKTQYSVPPLISPSKVQVPSIPSKTQYLVPPLISPSKVQVPSIPPKTQYSVPPLISASKVQVPSIPSKTKYSVPPLISASKVQVPSIPPKTQYSVPPLISPSKVQVPSIPSKTQYSVPPLISPSKVQVPSIPSKTKYSVPPLISASKVQVPSIPSKTQYSVPPLVPKSTTNIKSPLSLSTNLVESNFIPNINRLDQSIIQEARNSGTVLNLVEQMKKKDYNELKPIWSPLISILNHDKRMNKYTVTFSGNVIPPESALIGAVNKWREPNYGAYIQQINPRTYTISIHGSD